MPPFRFLHASDFHLERPPFGLAEVPDHLASRLVVSPYRAAERVFDAAVNQRVDFLVLAGDLVDALSAGPPALVFLTEQFDRLQALGIEVYWAAGPIDQLGDWASVLQLPANVHFFRADQVARVLHHRNGEPLVQILAGSVAGPTKIRPAEFRPDRADLFALAIAHGTVDPQAIAGQAIDYWALGGEHERSILPDLTNLAHYSGSPQGRCPREAGPHGCTLVQVDETRRARTSFVPTDVVRWQREQISIGEGTTRGELERALAERIDALCGDETGPDLLLSWTIVGRGPLAGQLRRDRLAGELVSRLRIERSQKRPAAWTVAIESIPAPSSAMPTAVPAELYEQQTILGEFLRATRDYEADESRPLDLERYLAERHLAGSVADAARLGDKQSRVRVLREAAALGVELLGPEEPAL